MKEFVKGLKIGTGIILPILLLVVLSVTVFAEPIQQSFTQKTYNIPVLYKGSYYEVVLGSPQSMTCVDLENELRLKRGDIAQMSTDADGTITITFKKDLILTEEKISMLSTVTGEPVKEILTK